MPSVDIKLKRTPQLRLTVSGNKLSTVVVAFKQPIQLGSTPQFAQRMNFGASATFRHSGSFAQLYALQSGINGERAFNATSHSLLKPCFGHAE